MKSKDIKYLAKSKFCENKKANKNAIAGLSVGLVLLLPILLVLFGVNISIQNKINNSPSSLFGETSFSDYREVIRDNEGNNKSNELENQVINNIFKNENLSSILYMSEQLPFCYSDNIAIIQVGEDSPINIPISDIEENSNYYSIIDVDKSDNYFPASIKNDLFIKGFDKGFTNKGKKQVVITESYLNKLNLTAKDVYGKTLSLFVQKETHNIYGYDSYNLSGYICKNYEVVGIIKNEISEMFSVKNTWVDNNFMGADLFFTSENVYLDGKGVLKPTYKKEISENNTKTKYFYENLSDKDIFNEEFMMLGLGNYIDSDNNYNNTLFGTRIYFEAKEFNQLRKEYKFVYNNIALLIPDNTTPRVVMTSIYETYLNLNSFSMIVSLVLFVIGSIVFLCALINLFCNIKHNVNRNKQYLATMLSMGATNNCILRLYYSIITRIINKASVFIIIFGVGISFGVKYLVESVLNYATGMPLIIPIWLIFILTVSVLGILYFSGFVIAYLSIRKIIKNSPINILKEYHN